MKGATLVLLLAACGGARVVQKTVIATSVETLPIACDVGLQSMGDTLFVFENEDVLVMRGGAVIARGAAPGEHGKESRWNGAATVSAPGGHGHWVVGVANGNIWRITDTGEIERVDARLGLGGSQVLSIAGAASTYAVGLANGVAASKDGIHLLHFSGPAVSRIAAARDRVAFEADGGIQVLDLDHGSTIRYPMAHISYIGFQDSGTEHSRLVVVTSLGDLYMEREGRLDAVRLPSRVRQVAISGRRTWLATRRGLLTIDRAGLLRVDNIDAVGRIFGSTSGDIWMAPPNKGALIRYSIDRAADPDWQAEVAPVFRRACSRCHLPGGDADVDLSTAAAWKNERSEIIHRVLDEHSMPPPGIRLSPAELSSLAQWLRK